MKTLMHRKILAIAAAAMNGLAMASGAALARGGGGFGGGQTGGFGGAHMGVVGGPRVGSFGVGRMGGLGVHPMGTPGNAIDRGLNGHGLGHTHVSHELRDHHASGLYFWPPLSDYNNDCPWPTDLTIESCPVGSATE
jgi:hypothetical protein